MDPPSLVSQLNKDEEKKRGKNAGKMQEMCLEMNGASAAPGSSSDVTGKEKGQMLQLLASLLNQGKTDVTNANDAQMLNALVNAATGEKTNPTIKNESMTLKAIMRLSAPCEYGVCTSGTSHSVNMHNDLVL